MSKRRFGFTLWRIPLAVVGGVVSSLAMPREDIWPMIFVSVGLILVAIRGLRFFPATAVGFLAGISYYLSQIEWMTLYLGPVPWLALSTLEGAIFGVGCGAIAITWSWLQKNEKLPLRTLTISLAIATLWTAREWLATNLPYGGFPWSRVSQALSESFLAKLVYFVGLSGLTFISVLLVAILLQLIEGGSRSLRGQLPAISVAATLLLLATLFTVPVGADRGELTLAAVQGNANAGLFANADPGTFLKNHLEATALIDDNPRASEIELIVWPENASDLNPQQNELAKLQIDSVLNRYQVPIILGAITQSGGGIFNSSLYYSADGRQLDQYDKKRPVPFAEYVPDRDFWYLLAPDLIGLVTRGYEFGTRDGIFELGDKNLGVLICFEIAIDDIGSDLIADDAHIILSQTNNADFGRSDETFQQAALARLRAIETGRTLVNISTVGISRIFLADGTIIDELPFYEPGVMIQRLPLSSAVTPAMVIRPYLDLLINLLAIGLVVGAISFRLARRSRSHAG